MSQPDPCAVFPSKTLASSVDDLNRHPEWFRDPSRSDEDNAGPAVIVRDDFYDDPMRIREILLAMEYRPYLAPSPQIVGADTCALFAGQPVAWSSSVIEVFRGQPVRNPHKGKRYNPSEIRERIAAVLPPGEDIARETWDTLGDGWNGAGHLMNANWKTGQGSIHTHYKKGDVAPRGWSGVVYLSPDAPPSSGTSVWREKKTGACVAAFGVKFDTAVEGFELAALVENRFNRLVLFRENVLHRAEHGFGEGNAARLTQTFFFNSRRRG
jgi:hypothetical protein